MAEQQQRGARKGASRALDGALAIYMGVCLLAMIWPGYAWFGGRIEPYVLGLPFSFAWMIGWLLASFLGMVVYHSLRSRAS